MELKLSPRAENYITKIARERDTLIDERNIALVNDIKKKGRVSKVVKERVEKLKKQLPSGIYVNPRQISRYIEEMIHNNTKNALSYSPFISEHPELKCCKQVKYRTGNIITGRDKEIEDILLSLTKSSKRGVILVGEPGVGKTAIVRALNNKLIERKVPRQLNGCYILNLDIPYIFSKYKEDPIGTIINALEVASNNDKVILFIDEVHQLLGQKMNDIMKPYLTEKLRFIGSTTIDEYHAIVTNDRALERRFTLVHVDEPNLERTCNMVKNTKSVYEEHHKCIIPDEVCEYAVINGSRFLGYRKNPDKSLDLLDIACSIMYEQEIKHPTLTEDNYSTFSIENLHKIKQNVNEFVEESKDRTLTIDYVNLAISSVTGISFGEIKNSLNYDQVVRNISSKIYGQEEQIKSLSNVVNIFKHIKADRDRPVSVLLVVGPAGCGKSSSCKELAKNLYGRTEYFIDYDMTGLTSEFMITELKGAPPGYVGYQKSGKLVKEVRNNPQSVIYFRGINQAHTTIKQYIIDACRRGSLVDSAEREAPLNNAVIVYSVTLNEKEQEVIFNRSTKSMGFGTNNDTNNKKEEYDKEKLKKIVGEELFKATDELIVFNSLDRENLEKVFYANVNEYLEMYDVDIDKDKLKDTVLENSKNGQEVVSKIASEVPKIVFKQLKQE